jgi:hypothetical protein
MTASLRCVASMTAHSKVRKERRKIDDARLIVAGNVEIAEGVLSVRHPRLYNELQVMRLTTLDADEVKAPGTAPPFDHQRQDVAGLVSLDVGVHRARVPAIERVEPDSQHSASRGVR